LSLAAAAEAPPDTANLRALGIAIVQRELHCRHGLPLTEEETAETRPVPFVSFGKADSGSFQMPVLIDTSDMVSLLAPDIPCHAFPAQQSFRLQLFPRKFQIYTAIKLERKASILPLSVHDLNPSI
jgi:hypothetical protein